MYVDPQTVISPKNKVDRNSLEVIFDTGPVDHSWSVAKLRYDGRPRIGIRWNGDEKESKMGVPTATAHPVWFILPDDIAGAVCDLVEGLKRKEEAALLEGYRQLAADLEQEVEAEEWTEGLIGDAY
ncbi:MAG: hypothetical protein ABSD43_06235 [Terracidiphilus sp.]|jgi:hypothetical protein